MPVPSLQRKTVRGRKRGCHSLGRRVDDKLDALVDVRLETLVRDFEQLLLVVIGLANHIDDPLGTIGLKPESQYHLRTRVPIGSLTPSSTGAAKNSVPVTLAMASPPSTPGR